MSELTLDEAIKHCLEVAEQNEAKAQKIGVQFLGTTKDREATECRECAADHRQLAEWLTELKELRNSIGAVKLKDMKEAVGLLQKLNTENDQLTSQLFEAKRLLKLAVKQMAEVGDICDCIHSQNCPLDECGKFTFHDEIMKFINN